MRSQYVMLLDEFDDHKALGELILIDRITNMTSACGVIKNSEVDEETDLKCVFAHGKLKANGDIFEEFYYNMESMTVTKIKPSGKSYTIGDEIPVEGESYQYPDYFERQSSRTDQRPQGSSNPANRRIRIQRITINQRTWI